MTVAQAREPGLELPTAFYFKLSFCFSMNFSYPVGFVVVLGLFGFHGCGRYFGFFSLYLPFILSPCAIVSPLLPWSSNL